MSYARFTGRTYKKYFRGPRFEPSEVYVSGTRIWTDKTMTATKSVLACYACRVTPKDDWYGTVYTDTRWEMLRHLKRHRRRGHRVPRSTISRLLREIKKVGDRYEART